MRRLPVVEQNRARLLAVSTRARSPLFPDTPTLVESGFADFDVDSWTGIMATGGTPQPVIERLAAELRTVVTLPEVVGAFEKLGMSVRYLGAREFADYYEQEIRRWAAAVRYSGAQPD